MNGEMMKADLELYYVDKYGSKEKYSLKNPLAERTVNTNLTKFRKEDILDYRQEGLICFWYLKEHELVDYMRGYITDKAVRRPHSSNSIRELWEELSNNFEIGEQFKVKLLKERCNVANLSSARISQLLKELSHARLLRKISHGVYVRNEEKSK